MLNLFIPAHGRRREAAFSPAPTLLGPWNPAKLQNLEDAIQKLPFLVEQERDAANQLDKEYKNRLLYSLLGTEGTQCFASQPLTQQLANSDHDALAKAVSYFLKSR